MRVISLLSLHNLLRMLLPAIILLYLALHADIGERGLIAWMKAERVHTMLQNELEKVKQQRQRTEANIKLLHPNSLDLDMLEERSREVLGYTRPNEIVIPVEE